MTCEGQILEAPVFIFRQCGLFLMGWWWGKFLLYNVRPDSRVNLVEMKLSETIGSNLSVEENILLLGFRSKNFSIPPKTCLDKFHLPVEIKRLLPTCDVINETHQLPRLNMMMPL